MTEEVLLKLFEIHHAKLDKRREKILFISRGSSAMFVALAAGITASEDKVSSDYIWIVIAGILLFSASACLKLFYDGRAYSEIAEVIGRLNKALRLFDKTGFGLEEPLYPQRWNKAVKVKPLQTVWHHCTMIFTVAILSSSFLYQFT